MGTDLSTRRLLVEGGVYREVTRRRGSQCTSSQFVEKNIDGLGASKRRLLRSIVDRSLKFFVLVGMRCSGKSQMVVKRQRTVLRLWIDLKEDSAKFDMLVTFGNFKCRTVLTKAWVSAIGGYRIKYWRAAE